MIEALQSVQVNVTAQRSGFQLTFNVGKNSLLQQVLLPAGFLDPMVARVVIIVTMNGMLHVLMDGMVTRQEMAPSNEPGQSTLTITGEDLSVLMDVVEVKLPFPAMPDEVRATLILAKYAAFGIPALARLPAFAKSH